VYVGVYSENLIDFETGKEENFLLTLRIVNELFGIIVRTCQVLIKIIYPPFVIRNCVGKRFSICCLLDKSKPSGKANKRLLVSVNNFFFKRS
jgi:hypothetical protein